LETAGRTPQFAFLSDEIAAMIAMFRAKGDGVGASRFSSHVDPDDGKFLHCAAAGGTEYWLPATGGRPQETRGSGRVVGAAELLGHIGRIALKI